MVLSETKYCKNCIYKGQFPNGVWGCRLSNLPINLDFDFCSKGTSQGTFCDNCHCLIPKGQESFVVSADDGGYFVLCTQCHNRL